MIKTIQGTPVVRLFRLTVADSDIPRMLGVGDDNFTASMTNEEGTLAMHLARGKDNKGVFYVFETYRNQADYQVHVNSAHFLRFAELASEALIDRQVYELTPVLMLEKEDKFLANRNKSFAIRLSVVTVAKGMEQKFQDIVIQEMNLAIEKEPGVLAMYATNLKEEFNCWLFFEIYQDEEAYTSHRQTIHFMDYIRDTADCVIEKTVFPLKADIVTSKGELHYEK